MSHAQPAGVEIRRADLADADQVGKLTERVYRHDGLTDDDYARRLRDGRSRIQEAVVLVAVADGLIIGTVTAARSGSRLASVARDGEIEVRMLAVDKAARGRGIANRLMASCEALARDEGLAFVVLSTGPGMYAAQRVYRRRGYVRQPDRDWSIGRSTLIVFRLSL